ncbi:uncharacterized protein BJ171DRAFT_137716 [Polychytrium aggregatum]|uniref:uncharacterized protein n=1 Tax=Polychytrium aggregatum TaxID=110093 RepID=UPI0022FDF638|nr:uncharacterized protein BJ171DRAFT_137716 [Polychytrium aggregatum]KAI9203633.1 hypothetical protein BJ171DRAFT_137716 [Polychytrium aggregatum]
MSKLEPADVLFFQSLMDVISDVLRPFGLGIAPIEEQLQTIDDRYAQSLQSPTTSQSVHDYFVLVGQLQKVLPPSLRGSHKRKYDESVGEETRPSESNSQHVLTKDEMDQRIESLIQNKRSQINESNTVEFLKPGAAKEEYSCARADAKDLNRSIQMKTNVAMNFDGPLSRSMQRSRIAKAEAKGAGPDLKQRIANIESHLNIEFANSMNPMQRIKAIENTLIRLEREYPAWAAFHFNQPDPYNESSIPPPPVTVATTTPQGSVNITTMPHTRTDLASVAGTGLAAGGRTKSEAGPSQPGSPVSCVVGRQVGVGGARDWCEGQLEQNRAASAGPVVGLVCIVS